MDKIPEKPKFGAENQTESHRQELSQAVALPAGKKPTKYDEMPKALLETPEVRLHNSRNKAQTNQPVNLTVGQVKPTQIQGASSTPAKQKVENPAEMKTAQKKEFDPNSKNLETRNKYANNILADLEHQVNY